MSASKILSFLCLSFIAGIFIESCFYILDKEFPQIILWIFLCLNFLTILIFLFVKKNKLIIFSFCFLFLIMGIAWMQISEQNILNNKLKEFNDKEDFIFEGVIVAEPDVRERSQKLKVRIEDSTVLITVSKYPEYKYLDKIKITGGLQTPMETDEFSYKNYLMKDKIYSVMYFPKIELISDEHEYNILTFSYEKILFLKDELRKSIRSNFLPPQSLILEGVILGDRGLMTQELKDKLSISGVYHIVAISGTHVVILSSIIMSLLLALGLWRQQAFYITVSFIILYITLAGLPPSGVRAGIMGILYLFAQNIGRQSMGIRVIILACSAMLFFNPLLLFYDVGFQLSFVAVLGLIYLEPIIKLFIKRFIKNVGDNLISIISATLAAQIFTLPIIIYNFGIISLVSPIANLLIIPIIYWLMLFGFLASVVGMFSGFLGFIFSIPSFILLTYFLKVIDFLSQPWAAKIIQNVHWAWVFVSYAFIISITFFVNKKAQHRF